MTDTVVAFVTCASLGEARRIAETLVADRLAACVNILPGVESCYRWEGRVTRDAECLLVVKTTSDVVEKARERVLAAHSYDVPEFIVFRIESGSADYLEWIRDSVGPLN